MTLHDFKVVLLHKKCDQNVDYSQMERKAIIKFDNNVTIEKNRQKARF